MPKPCALCCVFVVKISVVDHCNNFALGVVATIGTDVMWAFQLTTVRAFGRIAGNQCIMRATLTAA